MTYQIEFYSTQMSFNHTRITKCILLNHRRAIPIKPLPREYLKGGILKVRRL